MQARSVCLVAVLLAGCTSTRVMNVDMSWDAATVDTLAGLEGDVRGVVVSDRTDSSGANVLSGPFTRTPFLSRDSLFVASGFPLEEVREIVQVRTKRHTLTGLTGGVLAGGLGGGVSRCFTEAALNGIFGRDASCSGSTFWRGAAAGALMGGLVGALIGSVVKRNTITRFHFKNGFSGASAPDVSLILDLGRQSHVRGTESASSGRVNREGFFIGFGRGTGSLGVDGAESRLLATSGYLKIGSAVSEHLLLGVETTGWVKHSRWSSTLRSQSQSAVAYYYPRSNSGFFLKAGVGLSQRNVEGSASGITSRESGSESGMAFTAGFGIDIGFGGRFALTPYVNTVYSNFDSGANSLMQAGIGVNWY